VDALKDLLLWYCWSLLGSQMVDDGLSEVIVLPMDADDAHWLDVERYGYAEMSLERPRWLCCRSDGLIMRIGGTRKRPLSR
jgi:hypothetical protein